MFDAEMWVKVVPSLYKISWSPLGKSTKTVSSYLTAIFLSPSVLRMILISTFLSPSISLLLRMCFHSPNWYYEQFPFGYKMIMLPFLRYFVTWADVPKCRFSYRGCWDQKIVGLSSKITVNWAFLTANNILFSDDAYCCWVNASRWRS